MERNPRPAAEAEAEARILHLVAEVAEVAASTRHLAAEADCLRGEVEAAADQTSRSSLRGSRRGGAQFETPDYPRLHRERVSQREHDSNDARERSQ